MLLPDAQHPLIIRSPDGSFSARAQLSGIGILAGSFNPLHRGHVALREQAERILGRDVCFELSVNNADKAAVSASDLAARVAQFSGSTLALTAAPRFMDKAQLFPGCCFVVGFDTAARLLETRFYDDDFNLLRDAFRCIRQRECRFLVAGRLQPQMGDGMFAEAEHLHVPEEFTDLFMSLPESDFREDISSTELRRQGE